MRNSDLNLIPSYWKSGLEHVKETVSAVKRGQADVIARSPGGRDVYAVYYGEKQDFRRKANYNSACGAGDLSAYARKTDSTRPVVAIVGGIHGGEHEGIVAILNLIRLLETGKDFDGKENAYIRGCADRLRLVLIPCLNPDGRARVSYESMVGKTMTELRYQVQGTWTDGTLCGWPGCKAVHPIAGASGRLGGYFNDDGINIMHDHFFSPMAEETRRLMELTDREASDATVLLHGGANSPNHFMRTSYIPPAVETLQNRLVDKMEEAYRAKGIPFLPLHGNGIPPSPTPPSFNLTSVLHHISGGLSMTYESNQGLDAAGCRCTHEQIYEGHFVMFEQLFRFMEETNPLFPAAN
jgi:hypothetical protein